MQQILPVKDSEDRTENASTMCLEVLASKLLSTEWFDEDVINELRRLHYECDDLLPLTNKYTQRLRSMKHDNASDIKLQSITTQQIPFDQKIDSLWKINESID